MAKNIYLIRHGQSTFNAIFNSSGIDPLHFDARLSELGLKQASDARQAAVDLGVDVVVTSPLTRALQTTIGLFGDDPVPKIISGIHRESLENSCDVGRTRQVLLKEFPAFDFDHLDDTWWYSGEEDERGVPVEPDSLVKRRVNEFSYWIASRPENTLAVVGHAGFFQRLTGHRLENCEIMKWAP